MATGVSPSEGRHTLATSEVPDPSIVLPSDSTRPQPSVLSSAAPPASVPTQPLSPEDKLIFYAALQEMANELRRLDRERKKHQKETNH
jgi:hypothetical protein